MNEFVKVLAKTLAVIYHWLESIVLFFVPRRFKFKDINGEIALITGAGSGIGRLMAIKFAERGAILVLWDINAEGNGETVRMIEAIGGKAYAYKVDVTDKNAVTKTAAKVLEEVGDVTILVNNAGIVAGKAFLDLDDKVVEKVFCVNAMSHFWVSFYSLLLLKL